MPDIEIDFAKYVPTSAVFYEYYSILKTLNFVEHESKSEETIIGEQKASLTLLTHNQYS